MGCIGQIELFDVGDGQTSVECSCDRIDPFCPLGPNDARSKYSFRRSIVDEGDCYLLGTGIVLGSRRRRDFDGYRIETQAAGTCFIDDPRSSGTEVERFHDRSTGDFADVSRCPRDCLADRPPGTICRQCRST